MKNSAPVQVVTSYCDIINNWAIFMKKTLFICFYFLIEIAMIPLLFNISYDFFFWGGWE